MENSRSVDAGSVPELHQAVVNDEEQYSIWPAHRALPAGWSAAGCQGTREVVLAYIESVWTDMRPRSVRG